MDGKPFALLPASHRAHVAVQVSGDGLPRVETWFGRVRAKVLAGGLEGLAHRIGPLKNWRHDSTPARSDVRIPAVRRY